MATVGEMTVKLGLDKTGFDSGVDSAEKKSKGLMGTMGGVAKGVGVAAGAAVAAGGALMALASKTSATADEIDKMSERTGISRTRLQELKYAAGQSGVEFSKIESAAEKMTKAIGSNEESFTDLGIAVRNTDGSMRDSDDIFNDSINTLANMEDGIERNLLGQELFGKGFNDMIPLINAGADGIAEYSDRAHELGAVMDDDAIAANVQFQDSMDDIKTALQGALVGTMNEIMPYLQRFLSWIIENMPMIQQTIRNVMSVVGTVLKTAFSIFETYIFPLLQTMRDLWEQFGGQIMAVAKNTFDTIAAVIGGTFKVIGGILDFWIGLFTGDFSRMGEGLKNIWSGLWQAIKGILSGAWKLLKGAFGSLLSSIRDWFLQLPKMAMEWGKNMISGFFDGIKSMAGGAKDAVSGVISGVGRFIGFKSPTKEGEGRNIELWGANMIGGFMDGVKSALPELQGLMQHAIPEMALGVAGGGQTTIRYEHGGSVRFEGVNSSGEMIQAVDVWLDDLYSQNRRRGGR